MRKANQEITDQKVTEEILATSTICRIAMIDGNLPYLLPFNYGYLNGCIYIHVAKEGKKLEVLRKNNKVCFEIEQDASIIPNEIACKWVTLYRSLVGYGEMEIISGFDEKKQGLEIIMKHNGYKDLAEFEKKQVESVFILKLNITSITVKQSCNWNKIYSSNHYGFDSQRLQFRELQWEHLEEIHRLHSFPEVDEFNTLGIPENSNATREAMRTAIEDKKNYERKFVAWAIFEKDTNDFIGEAGMKLMLNRFKLGEIYYNLLPVYWGKGYGTETAKALVKFGFEKFKLHKIEAGVATENEKSIRVLEKAGMTREGLRRKILPIRGVWKDNYHYAIVEDDDRDY